MGLYNDADRLGRELELKRQAEAAIKEAEERARKEALEEVKRHEENKAQGMI